MRYLSVLTLAMTLGALAPAMPPVPRPAGEFHYFDASGKAASLSAFRGKVVLVQFLDTTCSHCQAMSQMLMKLQAEYGPKGFQAVGVAFNEATPEMVRGYVAKYHVGIPVGFASRDAVLGYLGLSVMERLSVPQVVMIDRRGQIRAQSDPHGTRELQDETYLRARIAELLK